jgi:hypothetical protein
LLSHQSDRDYPWIKFLRPLSTLSQLQGHETLGVLLLLVVSLHSKACWAKDSPDSNSFGRSKFVNPKDRVFPPPIWGTPCVRNMVLAWRSQEVHCCWWNTS